MNYKFYTALPLGAHDIRQKVFVDEQGFQNEFDAIDNVAVHLVIFEDNIPVSTARLFKGKIEDEFIVGRIAVLPEYRNKHIGAKIMEILENKIKELGGETIVLSAQCRVRPFYEKQGYKAQGESYLEGLCPHIKMAKPIASTK